MPILIENSYIPVAVFPWLSIGNLERSKFNYFQEGYSCFHSGERHRSYSPVLATREQAGSCRFRQNGLLLRVQSLGLYAE